MSAVTESGAWRAPSPASPFGLLADLGAAVAAEAGMPLRQIAQLLSARSGALVGDPVAHAAVVRGRREMTARRIDPGKFRPQPPSKPQQRDGIEQLLAWGDRAEGYASTAALRARAYLRELGALREAAKPKRALGRRPRTERGATTGYNSMVLAWAASQHLPIPAGGRVPRELVAAYEAAHAETATEPPAQATSATGAELRALRERNDRDALDRAKTAALAGQSTGSP